MSGNSRPSARRGKEAGTPWFFGRGSERVGPISARELKSLADAGHISRETLVWKQGMKDWAPARKIKNLFAGEAPQTAAEVDALTGLSDGAAIKACPFCAEDINPNARKCRHCGELIPTGSQIACPSCRVALSPGTQVCVACGYDFRSGAHVAGAPAPLHSSAAIGAGSEASNRQQQLLAVLLGAIILVAASQFATAFKVFAFSVSLIDTPTGKMIFATGSMLALGVVACLVKRKSFAVIVAVCGSGGLFLVSLWGPALFEHHALPTGPELADNPLAMAFGTAFGPGFGMYGTFLGGLVMATCATILWLRETVLPSAFVKNFGLAAIYIVGVGGGLAPLILH